MFMLKLEQFVLIFRNVSLSSYDGNFAVCSKN